MASTTPGASSGAERPFTFQLAPDRLWQAINPWNFEWGDTSIGNVTFNIGQTSQPELERRILDEVGSYGRQLGRIGDALEVLVKHFDQTALSPQEQDAFAILLGQIAEIRKVKNSTGTQGG